MRLAPYSPTHHEGVAVALELLELSSEDVLIDIGCGDGRLLTQVEVSYLSPHPPSEDVMISGGGQVWCARDRD